MRVHELAKELGMQSKDLIPQIKKLGFDAKNHMSVVDDEIVALIRKVAKSSGVAPTETESNTKKRKHAHATDEVAASEEATPKQAEGSSKSSENISKHPHPLHAENEDLKQLEKELEDLESVEEPEVSDAVKIRFPITVGDLAKIFNLTIPAMIKELMGIGVFANVNQLLNEEIVEKVAKKIGIAFERESDALEEQFEKEPTEKDLSKLKFRPPIVTMMGHVDHGKTSLLDAIRKTNVAAREHGAITQHIGAYGVDIPGKGHVTFLDTPGHEAFTAMRARGANLTDVVVLVVAADDGVMPQTIEAVNHAREAGCPIVVAINKADLPSANYNKVMTGLQKVDLSPEEWGGKTVCVKVSAKTGKGIEELLELLLLESEILELRANPDAVPYGTVVEGHLSKGSGPVATVIVQNGTLKIGDIILCGEHYGRVRSMKNDKGKTMKEAGPSYAAEISGLSGVPDAGERFRVMESEKIAKQAAEKRTLEKREREMRGANKHLALEDLYQRISEGNFKELKIIIKADVQGSIEAMGHSLERLSSDQCRVRVVHSGIGGINESDVMLAAASDAIILGFHVKADSKALTLIEKEKVDVRYYNIIYEAVEDVRKALEGLLEPTFKEVVEGKTEVRKIFKSSKAGTIGGSYVLKGKISRQHKIRVLRDNIVLHEGKIAALKRFKDDVRDVQEGYECGISVEGFDDLREGDIIESFRIERIATKLA